MAREGEKNGRSVLEWPRVIWLRKEYRKNRKDRWNRQGNGNHSAWSTAAMAAREGIAQSTMWSMLTGRTWPRKNIYSDQPKEAK